MTYQQKKSRQFGEALAEYERFKQEFREKHPDATPQEYEQAMRKKARELDI